MKPALILTLLLCALLFEQAERKSRKWYADRWLLRMAGFLAGAALVLSLT